MRIALEGHVQGDRQKIFAFLSFVLVALLLYSNIQRIGLRVQEGLKIFRLNNMIIFSPDDLKMRHKLGWKIIDYYEFVNRNTPDNAKILIPPQGFPWPMSGNAAYSRYFLYPRYLVNGKEKEAGIDLKKEKIQYVLVIWGESGEKQYDFTHGWPKFSVPAKRIIYKKPVDALFNYESIIVEKDFNPTDLDKDLWGIIEVDTERL